MASKVHPTGLKASRRQRIQAALDAIRGQKEELEAIMSEYQDWLDNMPESLDESPTAEKLQETIDTMEDSLGSVDEAVEELASMDLPRGFGRD